jgi:hypothetical protein
VNPPTIAPEDRTGIEALRRAVRIFDHCTETFNRTFSDVELLAIARAYRGSPSDELPDTWGVSDIEEALRDAGLDPEAWRTRKQLMPSSDDVKITGGAS